MAFRSSHTFFRRMAVVLPVLLAATVLPIVRGPAAPHVAVRGLALRAQGIQRAPGRFSMVGVTWPAAESPPRAVRVRTSLDGHQWTGWVALEIDPEQGPSLRAEGGDVASTGPLWVRSARFVDVAWTGHLGRGAKVQLIDPGRDPVSSMPQAGASPAQPSIITRSQWGADESIRKGHPQYAEPLQMVMIHHTATTNSYSKSDSAGIVRSIYAYHVKSNGWDDIGYNFLVDRYGQIFEGRYGGMDKSVVGAHARGFNAHSSGISVIGTFNASQPPPAAMDALKRIVAWRLDRGYVDAQSTTVMTSAGSEKYPSGQHVSLKAISGHRDTGNTDCPGNAMYSTLPSLRSAVAPYGDPKMYAPTINNPVFTPNGDGVADTVQLKTRFSSSVSWQIQVLTPGNAIQTSATGSGASASLMWNGKDSSGALAAPNTYRFRVTGHNARGSVRTSDFSFTLGGWPNGTLFRTDSGWVGLLVNQQLRHFVSTRAVATRSDPNTEVGVRDSVRNAYPIAASIGFRDGSVVRADSNMWIIADEQKRPVSTSTLSSLGVDSNSIIDTTSSALAVHPDGPPVVPGTYPDGIAVKGSDLREARVVAGQPRLFATRTVRTSYSIRDIDLAGPADDQIARASLNPALSFADGTLLKSDSGPAVYVVADGAKHHITSRQRFDTLGYKMSNVRVVTDAELALNPEGSPI